MDGRKCNNNNRSFDIIKIVLENTNEKKYKYIYIAKMNFVNMWWTIRIKDIDNNKNLVCIIDQKIQLDVQKKIIKFSLKKNSKYVQKYKLIDFIDFDCFHVYFTDLGWKKIIKYMSNKIKK